MMFTLILNVSRYIYIFFILAEEIKYILKLKSIFEENSLLNFTHEISKKNELTSLDVHVESNNNTFTSSL